MSEPTTNAPPIVLIHGLWMTARSWDCWVEYYRAKGHEVIVPSYPGFEVEVEALREKPRDHRRGHRARDARPSHRGGRGPGPPAAHHGPLLRGDLHPTVGQPRAGRRRGDDRLGA